jgi:hypothetical protein
VYLGVDSTKACSRYTVTQPLLPAVSGFEDEADALSADGEFVAGDFVQGLYDYDPQDMSPNEDNVSEPAMSASTPMCCTTTLAHTVGLLQFSELAFRAFDVMKVIEGIDEDGFLKVCSSTFTERRRIH